MQNYVTKLKPGVLVMTATIAPSPLMSNTERRDPALRIADYTDALKFYLNINNQHIDRIIFAENNGSDLAPLQELTESKSHGKRVEFISFISDCDPALGKGYSELHMLDKAVSESTLLAEQDMLWKVTGRLRIRNIERMIETAPKEYVFYCDLRNLPVAILRLGGTSAIWAGYRFMETRIFSCSVKAYNRYIMGQYKKIKTMQHPCGNSNIIENHLFEVLIEALRNDAGIIPRFRIQPQVEGTAGFSNQDYVNFAYRFKLNGRRAFRTLLPWLWV